MRGNQACLQCHGEFEASLTAHTHHPSASEGSLCYNCHMPHTTYGLLKQARSHEVDSPSVSSTVETGRENACNLCHLDRTLAWTAEVMAEWYGQPAPPVSSEQEQTADGLLQAVRGDAGQRAMAAWHMGWAPARAASRADWFVPVLAQLLEDPYAAVRYVAGSSLSSLDEGVQLSGGHMGSTEQLRGQHRQAVTVWEARPRKGRLGANEAVLMGEGGAFRRAQFDRILAERDDRRVLRNE
jgi:hypothetical protein